MPIVTSCRKAKGKMEKRRGDRNGQVEMKKKKYVVWQGTNANVCK